MFYKKIKFEDAHDPAVENNDRIRMLSNRLCENDVSENEKVVLRNEITSIAIGINSNTWVFIISLYIFYFISLFMSYNLDIIKMMLQLMFNNCMFY